MCKNLYSLLWTHSIPRKIKLSSKILFYLGLRDTHSVHSSDEILLALYSENFMKLIIWDTEYQNPGPIMNLLGTVQSSLWIKLVKEGSYCTSFFLVFWGVPTWQFLPLNKRPYNLLIIAPLLGAATILWLIKIITNIKLLQISSNMEESTQTYNLGRTMLADAIGLNFSTTWCSFPHFFIVIKYKGPL